MGSEMCIRDSFMQSIYKKYGMYLNTLLNFNFEGAAGMQKMADMMNALRENPPKEIGGATVESITDYKAGICKDLVAGNEAAVRLPKSNVLQYRLAGADSVIVRPSGTEPKIKIYITAVADTRENAQAKTDTIAKDMEKRLGI